MNLDALVRNRWMVAIRGGFAIAFGLGVLLWPGVTLPIVVVLFAVYAVVDGVWTVGTGAWTSTRVFDAWPVVLEGVVSVALGLLTLVRPFVPRQFIYVLAGWGIATGVLELLAAIHLPREGAGYWLLGTAGFSSLFLAMLLLLLPHADSDFVVRLIAAYAQVFGTVLLLAAIFFARGEAAAGPYVTSS
jgi:uncharacterized membrane protein HdeD (DUF308 family)